MGCWAVRGRGIDLVFGCPAATLATQDDERGKRSSVRLRDGGREGVRAVWPLPVRPLEGGGLDVGSRESGRCPGSGRLAPSIPECELRNALALISRGNGSPRPVLLVLHHGGRPVRAGWLRIPAGCHAHHQRHGGVLWLKPRSRSSSPRRSSTSFARR